MSCVRLWSLPHPLENRSTPFHTVYIYTKTRDQSFFNCHNPPLIGRRPCHTRVFGAHKPATSPPTKLFGSLWACPQRVVLMWALVGRDLHTVRNLLTVTEEPKDNRGIDSLTTENFTMRNNSIVVYQGPSSIDGRPIVVVLTKSSRNGKTGQLVQSWILRADVEPHVALKTGDDASICGQCPHRPLIARMLERAGLPSSPCYVRVHEAPLSIYRAFRRGSYRHAKTMADVEAFLQGAKLRIGSYGDPAAAPVALWQTLVSMSTGNVGYTHQWQSVDFDHASWAPIAMASVDSADEARQAQSLGMRYFRVSIGVDKAPKEVTCPASIEGGRKTTCDSCMLCGGTSKAARSIVIADHAAGHARRVITLRAA